MAVELDTLADELTIRSPGGGSGDTDDLGEAVAVHFEAEHVAFDLVAVGALQPGGGCASPEVGAPAWRSGRSRQEVGAPARRSGRSSPEVGAPS